MIISIVVLCIAAVIAAVDYYSRRRSLRRLYDMLQSAIDGTFQAQTFDESLYAAVENKLAEYLEASAVSARKTAAQKEQIESMISDISHQTKTPLANIMLYTELLKEQEESESKRENILLLESQTKKLNFLIQSLVKMSRLEAGILSLHPEKSSVAELLTEIEKQYETLAHNKGLYFHVETSQVRDVTAYFDRKWTQEALGNLVDNAIKYTKTGGVSVRVKQYGLYICIEVADTGIGIAEEEHAKVFGRFYRSLQVSDQAGVGIGLYLAREILGQESGYLKLASESGKGAVFSMYLPTAG